MKVIVFLILSLLPMSAFASTIVELAVQDGRFSTLIQALQVTGLDAAISKATPDSPLTVLAPTNAAFEKLPHGVLDSLLADPEALAEILKIHVIGGRFEADRLLLRRIVPALAAPVEISNTTSGVLRANVYIHGRRGPAINLIQEDIKASNGLIQVIDGVLLKPSL